jgi:hypothetical protein
MYAIDLGGAVIGLVDWLLAALCINSVSLPKHSKLWCFGIPIRGDPALFHLAAILHRESSRAHAL